MKSNDLKSNDLKSNDLKSNDLKSNDLKSNDLKEESNELKERENELNDREQKLRDLLRKLQKKQIALHEREQSLEEREEDVSRREREIRNESSRMKAKETVVMDALGRAANQEVNLKRWLDELQKTKTDLKRAEVEWLRRTKEKAAEKTKEEKKSNNNNTTSSPSASDLLKNAPTLKVVEDSPDSDRAIHVSCVHLKDVASFLTEVFECTNDISEQIGKTCETMSKLTSLLKDQASE